MESQAEQSLLVPGAAHFTDDIQERRGKNAPVLIYEDAPMLLNNEQATRSIASVLNICGTLEALCQGSPGVIGDVWKRGRLG